VYFLLILNKLHENMEFQDLLVQDLKFINTSSVYWTGEAKAVVGH